MHYYAYGRGGGRDHGAATLSCASTSARHSSNARAASKCPPSAARCKGVIDACTKIDKKCSPPQSKVIARRKLTWLLRLTPAPSSTSSRTESPCPHSAARCSGRLPFCSAHARRSTQYCPHPLLRRRLLDTHDSRHRTLALVQTLLTCPLMHQKPC